MAYFHRALIKNFHLPLPESTYSILRKEAQKAKVPATTLAREAIDMWLKAQERKAQFEAIASYAKEMAGTEFDLDRELEAAAVEHLIETERNRK